MQPNEHGLKSPGDLRPAVGRNQHVPAAEIDLILEPQRHRHGRECFLQLAIVGND